MTKNDDGVRMDTLLRGIAMQYEQPILKKNPNDIAAPPEVVGMERKWLFEEKEREVLIEKFMKLVKGL